MTREINGLAKSKNPGGAWSGEKKEKQEKQSVHWEIVQEAFSSKLFPRSVFNDNYGFNDYNEKWGCKGFLWKIWDCRFF